MLNERKAYCQTVGCRRRPDRAVELDLVDSWQASREFRTLTIHVGLCAGCAREAERRIRAALEARGEFHNLLSIIEGAVRFEKAQQIRLEAMTDQADRYELENGGLRQDVTHLEAELRLARADQRQLSVAGGGA